MSGFFAFTKKEFIEQLRTCKALILGLVCLFIGLSSPIMAKLLPQLLETMPMDGLIIILPPSTYMDAYSQFYKNMTQMGVVVILLVFGSLLTRELEVGTLIPLLSKGLSRFSVIMAKFTASLGLWTVCYGGAVLVNYGYTLFLFGNHSTKGLFFSSFALWLYGVFVLGVILLCNTAGQGHYIPLLLSSLVLIVLFALNSLPGSRIWNPTALASESLPLFQGTAVSGDLLSPIGITLAAILLCLFTSHEIFKRKAL